MLAQPLQVASCFSKAAGSYVDAARLQRQVAQAALTQLVSFGKPLGHLLDIGCGPGWLHPELLSLAQKVTAVDLSSGMLVQAQAQQLPIHYLQADAAALPLPTASVDQVFSSLMLQWCPAPQQVFAEIARVLRPGGQFVITTLIEGTLTEMAQAFAAVDEQPHIHAFLSLADLQHAISGVALACSIQTTCYQLPYADIFALAKELKALGANHLANRAQRGLTGKGYWQRVSAAYPQSAVGIPLIASYYVVQISGTKPL
ncbi:methyltransferase domain-containing protein [Alishewanella sp. 16-MA]|uniref:Methyltransferase domain-containing protein n=1 Tax=Alishewanella maricola TaxID=2795740 RepID=A0ABS8C5H0_9ALTE|nr:methyltransferase domain-containing protein [Alishewanella maricola]MCB5227562.1 methyltransferase domain-containing protein [Alishewanella maricola]